MANTTIKIQFGNSKDGSTSSNEHLSAEVDSRPTGLNAGKTTFAPGDDAYILVYKSDNVTITGTDCSAGSITAAGSATVELTEELTFEDDVTASLNVPAATAGLNSTTWYGRSLGSISVGADKITCTAGTKGVAVASVTYTATASAYKLSTPATLNGSTDYSILVLIQGAPAA